MPDPNQNRMLGTDDYFMLRAPICPYERFEGLGTELRAAKALRTGDEHRAKELFVEDCERVRGKLRRWVQEPLTREALAVSSGSLLVGLDRWRESPLARRGVAAERSLMKYMARAATRCTPFGLMAGVALGRMDDGSETRLILDSPERHRRHVRVDSRVVIGIGAVCAADRENRGRYLYTPNSTLYYVGERIRYYEHAGQAFASRGQLVSVASNDLIDSVISCARDRVSWETLVSLVCQHDVEVTRDEAEAYLNQLVDAQLIIPDVFPSPLGVEMLDGLRAGLRERQAGGPLHEFVESLHRHTKTLGSVPLGEGVPILQDASDSVQEFFTKHANALESSDADADEELDDADTTEESSDRLQPCFQVDLKLSASHLNISENDFQPVLGALEAIHRINVQEPVEPMRDFIDSFRRRYDDQAVPLAEALDPDHGIRFGTQGMSQVEPSPFLRIPLAGRDHPNVPRGSSADAWRVDLLLAAARDGVDEIRLDSSEIMERFPAREVVEPVSVAVVASLLGGPNSSTSARHWSIVSCWATNTLTLFGRFAHVLGDRLVDRLKSSAAREQELTPELLATISYLPPATLGNVCQQPRLREYEIPYRCPWLPGSSKTIPIDDLVVSVVGSTVVVRSRSLGVRIAPRIDHALNVAHVTSPAVYNFLGMLQRQGVQSNMNWTWGQLAGARWLPRVVIDDVVVSPQMWNLDAAEVEELVATRSKTSFQEWGFDSFVGVQRWRKERNTPRIIAIGSMSDYLTIDLENPLSVDLFLRCLVKEHRVFDPQLSERSRGVVGQGQHYVNELVVPIWNRKIVPVDVSRKTAPSRIASATRSSQRRRRGTVERINDGVLYARIYGGEGFLDKLLRGKLGAMLCELAKRGPIENWFFIRYTDPDPHLRVRLFGRPDVLTGMAIPALESACGYESDSGVWRLVFDGYKPELTRYGGPEGMHLAEQLFGIDSTSTVELISAHMDTESKGAAPAGVEGRWFLAAVSSDILLSDLGLDLKGKLAFTEGYGTALGASYRLSTTQFKQVGHFYRQVRATLEGSSEEGGVDVSALPPRVVKALRSRSFQIRMWRERMVLAQSAGHVDKPLNELVSNYFHMHCNRMFISQPRRQEAILLQLLKKHYTAQIKKGEREKNKEAKKVVA